MSAYPENHIRGKCSRCGNDTNRHWRAVYCWKCQPIIRDENNQRYYSENAEKIKEYQKAYQKNKYYKQAW